MKLQIIENKSILYKIDKIPVRKGFKSIFKYLLDECDILNSKIQHKLDYFYGPYHGTNIENLHLPMRFVNNETLLESEATNGQTTDYHSANAKLHWKHISDFILKHDQTEVQKSLSTINGNMYTQLRVIGEEILESQ